jgi:glycosyl transferase family 1
VNSVALVSEVTASRELSVLARVWGSSAVGVVSFYLPDRQALQGLDPETLDCDRDWEVFGTGVYVWVLQTFLRLRAAGAPVRLSKTPPASGVVLAHADYVQRLLAEAPAAPDLTIVSTRADRPQQIYADLEVVQNGSSVEDFQLFIPSWLQPGLIPRSPDRGVRVEKVAYVGARKQLHGDLAAAEWADALRSRGLCWDLRMVTFAGNDHLYSNHRWNDYSTSDLVVALRPAATWNVTSKPAAKLTNAWAAGVPAILSPELPYRELRRSSLDYLDARSGAEALDAIDRLRSDPALYSAMVENGFARAREFHNDRLTARWAEALWHTVAARTGTTGYRLAARVRGYRAVARRARRKLRAFRAA